MMDDRDNNVGTTADETATGSQFMGTAQDMVDRYTHCVLCGGNLHFTHQTDFARNMTQETAKCPDCGIRVRSDVHRLQ